MNADERRALFGPIEFLKGVGPIRAPLLAKLGLTRPVDLLFFFPRDYQDLTLLCRIDELEEGTLQTVDAVTVADPAAGPAVGRSWYLLSPTAALFHSRRSGSIKGGCTTSTPKAAAVF